MTQIVDGVARQMTGHIVGVSCEKDPHYDVMVNGEVLANLRGDQVKEAGRRDIFGVVK